MHKQWAAGAPVIGAAPVPSGRPKRPRLEGLSGSGALRIFFSYRKAAKATMAAKNTLKYKRNRLPPLLELINEAIDYCRSTIRSPAFKGTISALIRLIRWRLKLAPPEPGLTTARWAEFERPIQPRFDKTAPA